MPGRMIQGECIFVPLVDEYITSAHNGNYQRGRGVYKGVELGTLTNPDDASFRKCFSYGNYFNSFSYKPAWPMATVYEGRVVVGSAFWFDRGFIVLGDDVIPVSKFKMFCAERP